MSVYWPNILTVDPFEVMLEAFDRVWNTIHVHVEFYILEFSEDCLY